MRTILLLALLGGCAPSPQLSGPQGRTIDVVTDASGDYHSSGVFDPATTASAVVQAPPPRAWSALQAAYSTLGIPREVADPAQLLVGNRRLVLRGELGGERLSTFVSCGQADMGGLAADAYRVTLSVVSLARPAPGGRSEIQTRVEGTAADHRTPDRRAARSCTSTGRLEQRIHALARQNLAG